jgi:hypothetical protein
LGVPHISLAKIVGGTVSPPFPVRKTDLTAAIGGGGEDRPAWDATRQSSVSKTSALTFPGLKR